MTTFEPLHTNVTPGKLVVVENNVPGGPDKIEFTFNPSKLTTVAAAKWEQPSQGGAAKASQPTYKGPEAQTMELELIFDSWDVVGRSSSCDVQKSIDTLISWTRPTGPSRGNQKPRPPIVKLVWGKEWFPAYVASVNTTISMFDATGKALRATVKVSMKEMPPKAPGPNPTSGSKVGHQSYATVAGDTLQGVAARVYEQPTYWRGLAKANDIDDPKRIRPGTRLYLPPIDQVAEASK
jgi:nucleoid-associated protein YgaU